MTDTKRRNQRRISQICRMFRKGILTTQSAIEGLRKEGFTWEEAVFATQIWGRK